MKTKVCPCCDQPIKGMYCKGCRKIVLHPVEQEIHYYLNERHPEFEMNCSFHGNTAEEPTASRARAFAGDTGTLRRSSSADPVWSSDQRMSHHEAAAKKDEIRERMAARKREQEQILRSGGREAKFGGSRFDAKRSAQTTFAGDHKTVLNGNPQKTGRRPGGILKWFVWIFLLMCFLPTILGVIGLIISSNTTARREPAVPEPMTQPILAEEIAIPSVEVPVFPEELATEAAPEPNRLISGVTRDGEACTGFGHFEPVFEDCQDTFLEYLYIMELSTDGPVANVNRYEGAGVLFDEVVYSYTIMNQDGYAGMIDVSTDGSTGQIHGFSFYTSDEGGFFDMADAVLFFINQMGMAEGGLSDGRTMYEQAMKGYDGDILGNTLDLMYGMEISCYVPEDMENPDFYSMAIYAPGYYTDEEQ